MTNAQPGSPPVPLWLPAPQVWLKSEVLDFHNDLRFGIGPSDYDSASWPLRRYEAGRGFGPPIDSKFDWHVSNAWFLPWQFLRRQLDPCYRRSRANFVIRHIGHWNGDGERYGSVLSALSRLLRAPADASVRQVFALTPFSIIAQQFSHHLSSRGGGEILHTEILFFYTFESFIQEALVRSAHASGTAPDAIVGAYEHVYTNTRPSAVLPRDPAALRLAALVTPAFSWTGIRDHMPPRSLHRVGAVADDRPLELRETLFECRLQAHLMVAIAAACRGIASFRDAANSSPLVLPLPSVPTIDNLAPFWLRHLLGGFDHADACMRLLDSVARWSGEDVRLASDGSIIPYMAPRTEAEESVAFSKPPFFGQRDERPGHDSFRWGIFDTAIDDDAVAAWYRDICIRFV